MSRLLVARLALDNRREFFDRAPRLQPAPESLAYKPEDYATIIDEVLVDIGKIGRIDRFHPDKDPLAAGGLNQIEQFFVSQQIGANLGLQKASAPAAMMSRSSELRVSLRLMRNEHKDLFKLLTESRFFRCDKETLWT